MNLNTLIDYLSRYSFGHFCCRVKQGKRLSEFLQKYTDSGTENTHLTGYHILVVSVVYMIKSFLSRGGHFWCVSRYFDCTYTASLSRLVKTNSMQLKRRDPHPKSPHRETDDHISLVKWLDCMDFSHEQFTRRNLDNLGRHVLATSLTNSNQFELVRDHLIKLM